jgi:hypothetical protein
MLATKEMPAAALETATVTVEIALDVLVTSHMLETAVSCWKARKWAMMEV